MATIAVYSVYVRAARSPHFWVNGNECVVEKTIEELAADAERNRKQSSASSPATASKASLLPSHPELLSFWNMHDDLEAIARLEYGKAVERISREAQEKIRSVQTMPKGRADGVCETQSAVRSI